MLTIVCGPATKLPFGITVVPPGAPATAALVQLMSVIGIWLAPEKSAAGAVAVIVAVRSVGPARCTAISNSSVGVPATGIPFPICAAVTLNVIVGVPAKLMRNITAPGGGLMVIQAADAREPWSKVAVAAHRNIFR